MSKPIKVLRKNIKLLREKMGWSQAELARRLKWDPAHLSNYMTGREPGLDKIAELAKVFNVTVAELLSNADECELKPRTMPPSREEIRAAINRALDLEEQFKLDEQLQIVPRVLLKKLVEAARADKLDVVAIALGLDPQILIAAKEAQRS